MDEDKDDADHEDDDLSTREKRVPIAPLRLQGGNRILVVGTVTEKDTEKETKEQEQTQISQKTQYQQQQSKHNLHRNQCTTQ